MYIFSQYFRPSLVNKCFPPSWSNTYTPIIYFPCTGVALILHGRAGGGGGEDCLAGGDHGGVGAEAGHHLFSV